MTTKLLDKSWRISRLYRIKDKNKRLIQFRRNRAQEHFNQHRANRNIILKSRQLGFTTDETIDSLDDALFTPNFDSLFIAHEKQEALKIFDNKIDLAWKNFDADLKKLWAVDTDRANTFKFGFGDGSYSSISVSTSGRSGTYNRVHVTELAKLCKKSPSAAREILTGTIPAVPLDGRVDIESTADGDTGLFAEMFWEAWNRTREKLPTEFKAHFYNWTWDDEELSKVTDEQIRFFLASEDFRLFSDYQKLHNLTDREITYYWLKWLSLNRDWKALQQEYPTTPEEAFVSSGDKLFDKAKLDLFLIRAGTVEGDWTIFAEYNPTHRYGMGADVAEGIGRDSSTAVIWDYSQLKPEPVAIYKNSRIEADMFAYVLRDMGNRYGICLIGVERNNHGHTTLATLKTIYPKERIYKEVKTDKATDKKTEKLGWHTNGATKPEMLFDLNTAVNQETINVPSKVLRWEMQTYDKSDLNETRPDEEATNHWDILMAAAIGWQMRKHAIQGPIPTTVQGGVEGYYPSLGI